VVWFDLKMTAPPSARLSFGAGRAVLCGHFGNVQTLPLTHTSHLMTAVVDSNPLLTLPFPSLPGWLTIVLCLSIFFSALCPKI